MSLGPRQLAPILVFWVPGAALLAAGRRWAGLALLAAPVALGLLVLGYFSVVYWLTKPEDRDARGRPP